MRILPSLALVVACILFLGVGYTYWKNETKVEVSDAIENEYEERQGPNEEQDEESDPITELLDLAKNWPEEAREDFEFALKNKEPYKIALVGSLALGGNEGWASMLKDTLEEAYGVNTFEIEMFEYHMTSREFINSTAFDDVVNYKANLILYEPFILNDNRKIPTTENHANVESFMEAVGDAVVILQPSRPVYDATYYPGEVESLKEFAEEQGIPYLDHWQAWPDSQSEELVDYVISGESNPSEKGHQVWFEFLRDYFIAE